MEAEALLNGRASTQEMQAEKLGEAVADFKGIAYTIR